MQIHEKIKRARILADLTEEEMAEKLGIKRSTYQYWEKKTPSLDKIKQVAEVLGLPDDYFFISDDEGDTVNNDFIKRRQKLKLHDSLASDGVLFVPVSAKAGYLTHISDQIYLNQLEKVYLPGFPYRGERYRIFEVEGDSMEPTLAQGYFIVAERVEQEAWHQVANYYIYIIVMENDILIKRLFKKDEKTYVVISDNEEFYPQFLLPASDIKELWVVKRKIDWNMPPPKRFEIKV